MLQWFQDNESYKACRTSAQRSESLGLECSNLAEDGSASTRRTLAAS